MSDETKKPEPQEVIAWCGGLPLRVSAPVADILAAVWMGFQISHQTSQGPGPAEVVNPMGALAGSYGGQSDPDYTANEFLESLGHMTPLQREAHLSGLGLKVRVPEPEHDPTAENLAEMMRHDARIPKSEDKESVE